MSVPTIAFVSPESAMKASPARSLAVPSVTGQHNPYLFVSPTGVVYELVHVTPALAAKWLERNTGNRPLRSHIVERLTRDMQAGNFLENGDAARFDEDGTLIDSQHRMTAIVSSGVPAWMLVVSNLPSAARDTIDDGAKRTMADRLSFHDEVDVSTLAAVVRRAMLWAQGIPQGQAKYQPSAMEAFQFLADNPEVRVATSAAVRYRKARLLRPATIGLCWWLFSKIDGENCKFFFDRLNDGADMSARHPVLTLRNRLIEAKSAKTTMPDLYATALAIKSWNALRAKREVATLRWTDAEKFPQPK